MRLAHARAAVLSMVAGVSLTFGVLAGWPGAAQAGTMTGRGGLGEPEHLHQRRREHRHQVRGAPGGRHVYADSHADTQAVVDVTVASPSPSSSSSGSASPTAPASSPASSSTDPTSTPEQDAGAAVAVGLGFRLRFGFEFAGRVGADVEFADGLVEFADGITVADGLILSVRNVVSQTSASATVSASLDAFIASSPSLSPAQPEQQRESDQHGGPARTVRERPALAGQHQPRPEGRLRGAGLDREQRFGVRGDGGPGRPADEPEARVHQRLSQGRGDGQLRGQFGVGQAAGNP